MISVPAILKFRILNSSLISFLIHQFFTTNQSKCMFFGNVAIETKCKFTIVARINAKCVALHNFVPKLLYYANKFSVEGV